MKTSNIIPRNIEQEFSIEELFFSTTDKKGIILTGNSVFTRVSNYEYTDLVGKPHNTIRHPDMPQAVFKLLWDYILDGKPIVAYVKNMAKNGNYYWVMALVTSVGDNFLSVRFKPSSAIFPLVQSIYTELRNLEQSYPVRSGSRKEAILASEKRLLEILASHGFSDYDSFMRTALCEELRSRDKILQAKNLKAIPELNYKVSSRDPSIVTKLADSYASLSSMYSNVINLFEQIDEFVTLNQNLSEKVSFIQNLTKTFQLISLNASVEAAKLGEHGRSLSVIAEHLGSTSSEISRVVHEVTNRIDSLSPLLKDLTFRLAATRLQIEMNLVFCVEFIDITTTGKKESMPLYYSQADDMIADLKESFTNTFGQTTTNLKSLQEQLGSLESNNEDLRKTILQLLFSHLSGTIEASRINETQKFAVILEEVKEHIEDTKKELGDLSASIERIRSKISSLRGMGLGQAGSAISQDRTSQFVNQEMNL